MLEHLKGQYPELWAKTSLLTLGCYAGNWKLFKNRAGRQEKVKDGVYKVRLPMNKDAPLPFVEPNADTGKRPACLGSPRCSCRYKPLCQTTS